MSYNISKYIYNYIHNSMNNNIRNYSIHNYSI